jgi:hypothetical protein
MKSNTCESCDGGGESVALNVIEKTRHDTEMAALSTVRIVTSSKSGGLAVQFVSCCENVAIL